MTNRIRKATIKDANDMLRIKNQLPLKLSDGSVSKGGFLLGTNLKTYQYFIQHAYCLVAESNNQVVGFGIILPDQIVRTSDIWIRRNQARWAININLLESQKISYFEQLAFLSGNKRLAISLAYLLAKFSFDQLHQILFTTTVHEPILNLAAVPFIYAANGKKVGNIDEYYPTIGQIKSDIYLVESDAFKHAINNHPLSTYLNQFTII